jgi:hypothetical protein
MLEDKALGGLRVGWEFGFLSDFLNGKDVRERAVQKGNDSA